jgi:hypothetical protein
MRSITVILGCACLALGVPCSPAKAQVLIGHFLGDVLATPDFNLGFEVGANFSSLDGLDGAKRVNAAVFGLFADWRFSENFHLAGAVLPIAGRGADGLAPIPTGDPAFDGQTAGATMTRSLSYVEIPVLLKWAPQREQGFRAGAGASFGVVTGATDRYDVVSPAGMHYVVENDIGGQLPGLDMGLSVEAEWRFPRLSIAARYTQGLTDMSQDGSPNASHSRVLTGTGRIYLGKKPPP